MKEKPGRYRATFAKCQIGDYTDESSPSDATPAAIELWKVRTSKIKRLGKGVVEVTMVPFGKTRWKRCKIDGRPVWQRVQ